VRWTVSEVKMEGFWGDCVGNWESRSLQRLLHTLSLLQQLRQHCSAKNLRRESLF
jgi:hypothetical protein